MSRHQAHRHPSRQCRRKADIVVDTLHGCVNIMAKPWAHKALFHIATPEMTVTVLSSGEDQDSFARPMAIKASLPVDQRRPTVDLRPGVADGGTGYWEMFAIFGATRHRTNPDKVPRWLGS
jgi:hypothetical protein